MDAVMRERTVQLAKQGDSAAFAELYRHYAEDLYHFACYYLGNRHDAEDAVQTAVLTAYRSLPSLRKNGAFRSWLFKILSNCCKDALEKRSRRQGDVPLFEMEHMVSGDSRELSESAALMEALQKLPETDRKIILLSVIGGYTSREIAQMMQLRPGSVRSRLSRALQKLRDSLGEDDGKDET